MVLPSSIPLIGSTVEPPSLSKVTVQIFGAAITVTVAVPNLVLSTVEVALTVKVVAVSIPLTVSKPLLSMVLLLPPITLHVTDLSVDVPLTLAVNCWVLVFLTVAVAGSTLTEVIGEATVMERAFVSLPLVLVALIVKSDLPATVGVPVISPVLSFMLSPSGKLPLATLQVIGVVPVAARVWLYAVPTTPSARLVVVIVGAVSVGLITVNFTVKFP